VPAVSRTVCYVSCFLWVQRRCSLTEVKVKAGIQPEDPICLENVTYSGSGTWRFGQLDPLLLCDRVFQLPSNLDKFEGCTPKRYQRTRHRATNPTNRRTAKQLAVVNQVVIAEKLLRASVYRERRGADERDCHEGDPQPSVKTDDPLLAVNEQGDPRDRNGVLLCLQP